MLDTIYPGGLLHWELLWLQNVVFVFLQFTTGVALYTDENRYLGPLSALGGVIFRRTGRDLLLTFHAVCGLLVVGLNLAFVGAWYLAQSTGPVALLTMRPAIGVATALLTLVIAGLGLSGASMYRSLRPAMWLPTPPVGYANSRRLHRGLLATLVAVLGYHLFLTPRVTLVWAAWIRLSHPFGLLVLAMIALWGLLAGQVTLMFAEWATGRLISGGAKRHRLLGFGGAVAAIALAASQLL